MPRRLAHRRVVVAVARCMFGSMSEKSGERARGGVVLELGERHEVGREPVLQAGKWMIPVKDRTMGSMT